MNAGPVDADAVTADRVTVGFVGIGRMGAAMLQCVVDAGYPVAVYDPRTEATAAFADLVRTASTPGDAAEGASVVDIVVNDDAQVLDACLGDDGIIVAAAPGTVVLIHSTIALDTLRRVHAEAAKSGVRVLDAAISGERGHLSAGELCVMVGGDEQAFTDAKPVLDTYGGMVVHLGPLGAGLDVKLALNVLRYLSYVASQESARLADHAGIDPRTVREIVRYTGASNFVGDFSTGRQPEDYERRVNNAETAQKDLRAAIARAAELDLQLPAAGLAVGLMHGLWAVEADGGRGES